MYYADDRIVTRLTYNTAIGYDALRGSVIAANNTGQYNTAVGDAAMLNITSGNQNTAVGEGALRTNSSGIRNTAICSCALRVNTTANYNTALGYQVLER